MLDSKRVVENTGEANGVRVSRVSRMEVEGRSCRLLFDYEITDGLVLDTRARSTSWASSPRWNGCKRSETPGSRPITIQRA